MLRPATPDDLVPTWLVRSHPGVSEWLNSSPSDLDAYRDLFLDPGRIAKTVVIEREGTVIGEVMCALEDAWAQVEVAARASGVQVELGWVIDPAHGGQGLATEAVLEMMRCCFEDLGLRRVTAYCYADNAASWRLMERVGMRREVTTRADLLHRRGTWHDGYGYAMLASEWSAKRSPTTATPSGDRPGS